MRKPFVYNEKSFYFCTRNHDLVVVEQEVSDLSLTIRNIFRRSFNKLEKNKKNFEKYFVRIKIIYTFALANETGKF